MHATEHRPAAGVKTTDEITRPHVLSLRFSDEEKEKLERACKLYAEHWKRKRAGQAEVLRAGLAVLLEELEKAKPHSKG